MASPREGKQRKSQSHGKRTGDTNGRIYVHANCGGETEVTARHFRGICDAYRAATRTYCVRCEDYFPLKEFSWSETDETLTSFRARMKALSPPKHRRIENVLQWLAVLAAVVVSSCVAWFVQGFLWKPVFALGGGLLSLFVFLFTVAAIEDVVGIVDPTTEL